MFKSEWWFDSHFIINPNFSHPSTIILTFEIRLRLKIALMVLLSFIFIASAANELLHGL